MTACVIEPTTADEHGGTPQAGCAITIDGCYAARLARRRRLPVPGALDPGRP